MWRSHADASRNRRFRDPTWGAPLRVERDAQSSRSDRLPALVFVRRQRCGASRRMESLVAGVKITQKERLRVVDVDADRSPALVRELDVTEIPSLVLIKDRRIVGRLEGRVTGRQIQDLIRPHLASAGPALPSTT